MNILKQFNKIKHILFSTLYERVVYFLIYILIARFFTKEDYGAVITVIAFVNILSVIFDLGLPPYIQREAAIDNDLKNKLRISFSLKLILLPVYLAVTFLYFKFTTQINSVLILTIAVSHYFLSASALFNSVLTGKGDFLSSYRYILVSRTVALAFIILSIYFGFKIEILFIGFLFAALIQYASIQKKIGFIFSLRDFSLLKRHNLKTVLSPAILIALSYIFVTIYDRIDVLILQEFTSLETVAVYSVAYSLYRNSLLFAPAFIIPFYNKFSKSYNEHRTIFRNDIMKISSFFLIVSIIIITSLFFISDFAVRILFSVKYQESGHLLFLLSFALPGILMNNLTGIISNSIKQEKIATYSTGIVCIINIFLNTFLILKFGVIGAVITTIISEYMVFFIQVVLLRQKRRENYFILK